MNVTLENAGMYIAIIMFAVAIVKCVIFNPLSKDIFDLRSVMRESLGDLRDSIESLGRCVRAIEEKLENQNERLARLEEASKTAHKRVDRLEKFLDENKALYNS